MPLFEAQMTRLDLQQPERRSGFDDATSPLTAVAVWNELGGGATASGEIVTERTALAISTVYTAVTVISEAVASLPCKLLKRVDNGSQEATDNHLYDLLAYSPNDEMTAFTFWSTMVGSSALTGNAYAEIRRDLDGSVSGLWPLNALKTEPIRLSDGSLAFRTTDGVRNNAYRLIASKDILHFPLFSLDGVKGVGPVAAARETYALAKAAEGFGARWFGNGAHVPSILINKGPKPDPKVQRELRESWQSAHGGQNANKQGFLFGEWSVETIGLSPEDSQFLGTRNYQRSDIAAMFHLQPHQVGDTTRLSNSNFIQSQLSFMTDCLRPILTRIEAEIKRKLIAKQGDLFVRFDEGERTRGDVQATMQTFALGRQWSILTANECRQEMGLNPIGPEGDVLLYPVNMANSKQLPAQANLTNIDEQPEETPQAQ